MNIIEQCEQIIYSEDYMLTEAYDALHKMLVEDDLTVSEEQYVEERLGDLTAALEALYEGY